MDNKKSNSNKCVNVSEIRCEEKHEYMIGDTRFVVRSLNKNEDPKAVKTRLLSVMLNHSETEC